MHNLCGDDWLAREIGRPARILVRYTRMSPRTLDLPGNGSPGPLPVQRVPTRSPATVAEPIRRQRGKSRDVDEDQVSSATDVRTWLPYGHGPRLEREPRGTQSYALYSMITAKLNNRTRDRIVVNDSHARLARGPVIQSSGVYAASLRQQSRATSLYGHAHYLRCARECGRLRR